MISAVAAYLLGGVVLLVVLGGGVASVVCAAKGKWLTAACGPWLALFGVPFIAASRPARPDSWWARKRYDGPMRAAPSARSGPRSRRRLRLEQLGAAAILLAFVALTAAAP